MLEPDTRLVNAQYLGRYSLQGCAAEEGGWFGCEERLSLVFVPVTVN